jgi:L-rhamnonate dehydratase
MAWRLKEFDIYWFEDLLTPDELEAQAALRDEIKPILVAGGEHEFTRYGFADIARTGALDVWQPDVTWCGGITEALRILDLAAEHGAPVVPHRGGEIWGIQLIVASGCEDLAEWLRVGRDAPRDELWLGEPEIKDGYLAPSDRPGFGVTLNEAML